MHINKQANDQVDYLHLVGGPPIDYWCERVKPSLKQSQTDRVDSVNWNGYKTKHSILCAIMSFDVTHLDSIRTQLTQPDSIRIQ